MKFHATTDGLIAACNAEKRACPISAENEHFLNTLDAAKFVVKRELIKANSVFATYDQDWKETKSVGALNDDFKNFMSTPQAKAAPLDLGDWRAALALNAQINGDLYADANPDTSLTNAIYDPSPDDDENLL